MEYLVARLRWNSLQENTAFYERDLKDLVWIKGFDGDEEDEYVIIERLDFFELLEMKKEGYKKVKITYDGWLMIGYDDWEAVEIEPKDFYKYCIKNLFERVEK